MAGAGPKRRVEENTKRLATLRMALMVAPALHFALRLLAHGRLLSSFWASVLFLLSVGLGLFCYSLIRAFATPVYSETNELLDGGADLSMRGMCGHYHDILYISVFAQAASGLSGRFWLIYLVVPGYGLFLLWRHVLQPYFYGSGGAAAGPQSDAERKKEERTQERADRRRQKSMSKR